MKKINLIFISSLIPLLLFPFYLLYATDYILGIAIFMNIYALIFAITWVVLARSRKSDFNWQSLLIGLFAMGVFFGLLIFVGRIINPYH